MRLAFAVLFSLLATTITLAQGYPKAEVFGGYSYVSADFTGAGRANLNGWNGALTGNFSRWLGVTADIGGAYGTQNLTNSLGAPCPPFCGSFHLRTHAYTFLFGPQITVRTERFSPFVHALFGAAHTNESVAFPLLPPGGPTASVSLSDTSFATALGGGVDLGFSHSLAWRVQGDYLQSRVFSRTQNNFRMSTGIVFRF